MGLRPAKAMKFVQTDRVKKTGVRPRIQNISDGWVDPSNVILSEVRRQPNESKTPCPLAVSRFGQISATMLELRQSEVCSSGMNQSAFFVLRASSHAFAYFHET